MTCATGTKPGIVPSEADICAAAHDVDYYADLEERLRRHGHAHQIPAFRAAVDRAYRRIAADGLTRGEQRLLAFAKARSGTGPLRPEEHRALYAHTGLTPAQYRQRLTRLLDHPAAQTTEHALITALRRTLTLGAPR